MVRMGMSFTGTKRYQASSGAKALVALLGAAVAFSLPACKTPQASFEQAQSADSQAAHIKKITFLAEPRGTVVKLFTSRKTDFTSYKLADPLRLAVEMPGVALDFDPKRIAVEDEIISAIGVVRFTKVNSVRLELELLSDAQFKISQKPDYIEVLLTHAGAGIPAATRKETTSAASAEADKPAQKEGMEGLGAENDRLKTENLEVRKNALRMEEENATLKRQLEESRKQLEEASSLSKTMQARVAFVEQQLSELDEKVSSRRGGGTSHSGPSLDVTVVPLPMPTAATTTTIPVPVPTPSSGGEPSGNSGQRMIEVNQTVAAWLKAWNEKNISSYTAFYAPDFKSKDMGLDKWLDDKRVKFSTSKGVKITAKDVKITMNPDATTTVVFEQRYKTGSYKDRGTKQLILAKRDGRWRITSEEWSLLQ